MLRAIKIDVTNQTVTEVELKSDNIDEIYKQLDCETFEVLMVKGPIKTKSGIALYVDEESRVKPSSLREFAIEIRGLPYRLIGHGLLLGYNMQGDSVDLNMTLEEAQQKVVFR